jgi:PST family polysaccharide transporter
MQMPFNVFNQVYYPKAAKEKDLISTVKVIFFAFVVSLVCYSIGLSFGELFIEVYAGNEMLPAYEVFLIFSIILPINVISHNLGNCVLLVFDRIKQFNISVFIPALFYLVLVFVWVKLGVDNIEYYVWTFICYVFLIGLFRLHFSIKILKYK